MEYKKKKMAIKKSRRVIGKKSRRIHKRKQTRKWKRGGSVLSNNLNTNQNNLNTNTDNNILENIIQERKDTQQKQQQSRTEILNDTANLVKGASINALLNIGNQLGIDISDSKSISDKLTEINQAITNPANREKMKEIVQNTAEYAGLMVEAAQPFIKPLVDTTMKASTEAASKIGESAVKIGLNTAEEIPGVGVLIGTIRSLSNAGEALTAATNAAGEVVTSASDTMNATAQNFDKLMAEKNAVLNRTRNSIQQFQSLPRPSLPHLPPHIPPHLQQQETK